MPPIATELLCRSECRNGPQADILLRHNIYRCGPKGDIVAANDWVPLVSNYPTRPALRRPSVSLSASAGSLNGSRAK